MPIILIVIAIIISLVFGSTSLVVATQDKDVKYLGLGFLILAIGILLSVWTYNSFDQGLVLDGTYKIETVKTINGSVQIVMDSKKSLHNITKKLGATFPNGAMVKVEYYEDTTNGIDWLNSNSAFYTVIFPAQGE